MNPLTQQFIKIAQNIELQNRVINTAKQAKIPMLREILKRTPGVPIPSDTTALRQTAIETARTRLYPNLKTEINKAKPENRAKATKIVHDVLDTMSTKTPGIRTKASLAVKFYKLKRLQ